MTCVQGPPEVCDILREALQYTRVGDIVDRKVVFALKPSASMVTYHYHC